MPLDHEAKKKMAREADARVEEASEESFPASDAPAHGAGRSCEKAEAEVEVKQDADLKHDRVEEASQESFPASDPPGGTSHV